MKSLQFEGKGFEYFKIWIVNILLTIVTLSLYYPWAKVRNLRYFYGNTTLEGRNFDYHATGKQLFVSYVIALVLLIIYVILQQASPVGGLLVFVLLFAAIPWIIWRGLMFGMRMTSFSNVRFNFDGNLKQAYFNYLLLPILLFLSIYVGPILAAVVLPMMGLNVSAGAGIFVGILVFASFALAVFLFALIKKRNTEYALNGSSYGQGRFQTELSTKVFLKILAKTIGLYILFFILFMIIVAIIGVSVVGLSNLQNLGGAMNDPSIMAEVFQSASIVGLVIAVYVGFLLLFFLVLAYSFSRQRNYIYAQTVFDNKVQFESSIRARSLVGVMLTNLLIIIFTLGLGYPWAKVRMAKYIVENTHVDTELGFDDYITQQAEYQSSLGDQIGDAFDVGVGVAI